MTNRQMGKYYLSPGYMIQGLIQDFSDGAAKKKWRALNAVCVSNREF